MAELRIMGDKGIIVNQGLKLELFKGDTIQFNGKTATNIYFVPGIPNVLRYQIGDRNFAATPEELAMVQKVGGRKRKTRKNKSRRYRRV